MLEVRLANVAKNVEYPQLDQTLLTAINKLIAYFEADAQSLHTPINTHGVRHMSAGAGDIPIGVLVLWPTDEPQKLNTLMKFASQTLQLHRELLLLPLLLPLPGRWRICKAFNIMTHYRGIKSKANARQARGTEGGSCAATNS